MTKTYSTDEIVKLVAREREQLREIDSLIVEAAHAGKRHVTVDSLSEFASTVLKANGYVIVDASDADGELYDIVFDQIEDYSPVETDSTSPVHQLITTCSKASSIAHLSNEMMSKLKDELTREIVAGVFEGKSQIVVATQGSFERDYQKDAIIEFVEGIGATVHQIVVNGSLVQFLVNLPNPLTDDDSQ